MYADSNVFVNAALDKGMRGDAARKFISTLEAGRLACATSYLVLDEVIWVVLNKRDQETAVRVWRDILEIPHLRILSFDESVAIRVPSLIERYGLSPRDAVHAATCLENGISSIVSADKDFDAVKELKRLDVEDVVWK